MLVRSRSMKASGGDVGIEVGNADGAAERGEIGGDRQARQGDHQRDQPWKDQHADRVEADHGQRVDLLAHLHRADLGGDRASRSPGDHDGGEQHAHLAQHQDADQFDDEDIGPEIAELERALLRHDRTDDGRHQDHHRQRPDAHPVDLVDDRRDVDRMPAAGLHLRAADRRAENVHGGRSVFRDRVDLRARAPPARAALCSGAAPAAESPSRRDASSTAPSSIFAASLAPTIVGCAPRCAATPPAAFRSATRRPCRCDRHSKDRPPNP